MPHGSPTLERAHDPALGPSELFFSTTDSRGVIRQGNSVFARISGFSLEEMVGLPHNLVRHPDMPAGAFRLMWSWLEAGRPIGTYVCNRTKEGAQYWVFAVVSPLHDGFVSVRMAPLSTALPIVKDVYAETRLAEHDAAAAGATRREVAEVGEAALLAALARRGLRSYEDFMHQALPAEVASRGRLASEVYQRPDAVGEIAQVLRGTRAVDQVLAELVAELATFQQLGDELADTADHVLEMTGRLEGSVHAAQEASALVADKSPVLGNVARVMAQPMAGAIADLHQLNATFEALRSDIAQMRFQISLATLYNDMVAAFAAEVHDGVAPAAALSAVPVLREAAQTCVVEMAHQVQAVNADLRAVASVVAEAATLLEDFRRFIGQWRQLVFRHARTELGEQVAPIDEEIRATWGYAERLQQLSERAAAAIVPFDAAQLQAHLETMRVG